MLSIPWLDNFGNERNCFDQNSNTFLGWNGSLGLEQIDGAEGLFYSDKGEIELKGAKFTWTHLFFPIDYDNKVVTAEVEGKEQKRIIRRNWFSLQVLHQSYQSKVLKLLKETANLKQLLKMYNSWNCTKCWKLSINLLTKANISTVSLLLVVVTSVEPLKPLNVLEKKLSLLISLILFWTVTMT